MKFRLEPMADAFPLIYCGLTRNFAWLDLGNLLSLDIRRRPFFLRFYFQGKVKYFKGGR